MIVKINKEERDDFEKDCASLNYQTKFFTMGTNDKLIQVEISDDGQELSLSAAFAVGRLTGMTRMSNALIK